MTGLKEESIKIAFCVKTVDEARNWNPDNFTYIINKLNEHYLCDFIFVGVDNDKDVIDKICKDLGFSNNIFHTEGLTDLKQLNAVFEKVDFLINFDNGMDHFAAASGCPTVTMFSSADPWKFRPLHDDSKVVYAACDCRETCDKHSRKLCHYECLNSIDKEEVYSIITSFIEKKIK